jgi:predicted ferric reductase
VLIVHATMWTITLSTYGVLVAPRQLVAEGISSLALVLICCNLLLATRAPLLEKGLTGLDKLFVTHRLIGLTIAVLVVTHYTIVPKSVGWVPSKFVAYPMILLLLAMIFVASAPRFPWAKLVPLKYQTWKATHRFNGLFVLAVVTHSLFAPAYVHMVPTLRVYVYGVAALGLLAWIYRELLFARFGPFRALTVGSACSVGADVTEVTLASDAGPYPRKAGQFAFLSLAAGPSPEQHPFTISSDPRADVRFSIKASGDFTDQLGPALPEGSAARVEGPYGAFTSSRGRADQLWLAGGIGITPFLAMAADLDAATRVLLVWSVRRKPEALYTDELSRIAYEKSNFEFIVHATAEQGHLELDALHADAALREGSVFVCGPVPMREAFLKQLKSLGVPRSEIYYEEFRLR